MDLVAEQLESIQQNQTAGLSVALQFPDSCLTDATKVYMGLKKKLTNMTFYVLGDTSYSECCVDDVNASHADANDVIVKFGRSCFSSSSVSK